MYIQWIINGYLGLKVLNIYACEQWNAHELWMNVMSQQVHFFDLYFFLYYKVMYAQPHIFSPKQSCINLTMQLKM